jgi:peptide/nickel transport system substrate-binding protein
MEIKQNTSVKRWWDKLGTPQYGGEITIRASRDLENFDPFYPEVQTSIYGGWMERLLGDDWMLDPEVWNYQLPWHPSKYMKGVLAESWEFPDPGTHIIHLRKGIHWQNIPPANGRELTADDVVFHYNRLLGFNNYPNPSPYPLPPMFEELKSVKALDRYTVEFKWRARNPEFIMEALHGVMQRQCLENQEAVQKWGDLRDWHHAVGAGAFFIKDFTPGKSATLVKDNNYWGYDERFPKNKIPYVDSIKYLVIPDFSDGLAAMRAGTLDIISGGVSYNQAQAMQKTNPEIMQIRIATRQAVTVQPRFDKAPFNDLRVRKAMQLAFNLPALARDYYHNTVEPYPSSVLSSYFSRCMPGWGFPYADWPQDLKDEYAYNPNEAKRLLAEAGFPKGFKTNIVVDTASDLELFKIIVQRFLDIGIEMEVRPMESNACTSFIEARKQDQLVYREYGPLGHCYAPFQALTRLKTNANDICVSDPVFDSYYDKGMASTTEDELKQILKDMNERVARQHFAVSLLQPVEYTLCQPWLKGYNGQAHAVWMGVGGPSRLSFYGARYWIDHKLKKSLGR